MDSERVFPRGVRPVSLDAISECERLEACPHRAQAAVNIARAIAAAAEPVSGEASYAEKVAAERAERDRLEAYLQAKAAENQAARTAASRRRGR